MSAAVLSPEVAYAAAVSALSLSTGWSEDVAAEVLAPPVEGVCGWLDGSCHTSADADDFLCKQHRAWIGGAR